MKKTQFLRYIFKDKFNIKFSDISGRMDLPRRGVYLFIQDSEYHRQRDPENVPGGRSASRPETSDQNPDPRPPVPANTGSTPK